MSEIQKNIEETAKHVQSVYMEIDKLKKENMDLHSKKGLLEEKIFTLEFH